MKNRVECMSCGTILVEIGNNQVNGRYLKKDETICPECWGRCEECGDWYRTGEGCPKHEEAKLLH